MGHVKEFRLHSESNGKPLTDFKRLRDTSDWYFGCDSYSVENGLGVREQNRRQVDQFQRLLEEIR